MLRCPFSASPTAIRTLWHRIPAMLSPPAMIANASATSASIWRCASSDASAAATCSQHRHPYKAVVFDMGGVLIPGPARVFRDFEGQHGLSEGDLLKAILTGSAWHRLETGQLPLEEFAAAFSQEVGRIVGRPIDVSGMLESMDLAEPYPEMMGAVRQCRLSGLKTALLTNNWHNRAGFSLLPLDTQLFDVIVESCKVGCRKPDEKIFRILLDRLGLPGHSVVFLDDLGQNLKAAKALGITTIKVNSTDQALRDLQSTIRVPLVSPPPSASSKVATDDPPPPGTIDVPERLRIDTAKLSAYLSEKFGQAASANGGCGISSIRAFTHGQSNPTYYVKFGDLELVLRKKPPGKLLPSAHAVEREYRVMSALRQSGVPLPRLYALCEDPSVLGTPFYLMEYLRGRVFTDLRLPELSVEERGKVYREMIRVLALIHRVNPDAAGLGDFGKHEGYLARNIERWRRQYEASLVDGEIPEMRLLHDWLVAELPKGKGASALSVREPNSVVHGDYRLDNLVFDPVSFEVIGVLDWELATLGHPYTDLATCLFPHRIDPAWSEKFVFPSLRPLPEGIPTESALVSDYCGRLGIHGGVPNIDYYHAFVAYRIAAILQGVYKRSAAGQSSSARAKIVGSFAKQVAALGWSVAQGGMGGQPRRGYSSASTPSSGGLMATSVADLRPEVREMHARIRAFVQDRVLPLEQELNAHYESQVRWTVHPAIEKLKSEAKSAGLWNLFLPVESDPERKYSPGLTNLEYAFLCEEMGWSVYASELFNCSAPDTGNMEVLVRYGTEEQKRRWLAPLLEGRIRSCFAMTEPAVASSDAANIEASIRRSADGGHYIVDGHKWWISGAMHPDCKLAVFMGKTDPTAAKHRQQTMLLVPMDSPGVSVVRPLHVFGFVDAPGGHAEIRFNQVRVPISNVLLGEGRGFEIAQGRLGPGRVHHCMRLIGHCERALALACQRSLARVAFGKPLAAQSSVQQDIAWGRTQLEAARLLVLKTAHLMDTVGNKAAAREISLIKVMTPRVATEIIDRAIQVHGAAGLSLDQPLSVLYAWSRVLRLADGPDEVHMRSVARMELAKHAGAAAAAGAAANSVDGAGSVRRPKL